MPSLYSNEHVIGIGILQKPWKSTFQYITSPYKLLREENNIAMKSCLFIFGEWELLLAPKTIVCENRI